jgi:glucose-1-phosphate thymidylyltransferase
MSMPVAVIPVAGVGTRLRPQTHTVPKALLHVAGKPMVAHILDELRDAGVRDFVLVIGYMGDRVRTTVSRLYPDLNIRFVEQPEQRGLGHAIYLTKDAVGGRDAIIVLGDTLFRVDFRQVFDRHVSRIGVKEVEDPRRFGVVDMQGDHVRGFVEKPEHPPSKLAIVGIYYIVDTPALYGALDQMIASDRSTRGEYQLTDALQTMLERGVPMEVFQVEGWYDCGKPETLLDTNRALLDLAHKVPKLEGSVVIPPVAVAPDAVVKDSVIGPYATVASGATILRSIIRNSIVSERAQVTGVLLDASLIGEDAIVEGVPWNLNIGDSSEMYLG